MQSTVQELLLNVVLGMVTIGGLYLLNFINKWITKLKAETENLKDERQLNLALAAIERVEGLAQTTVLAIEGVTAKKLRELVKQGNAPRSELENLAEDAIDRIIGMLEPKYYKALEETFEDVDTYVKDVIESTLENFKKSGLVN
ncbi:hypothetical protein [Cellulosilyticum sp. I15G10I2]|uniref:hypothetical protein n=1 Tax=Cellulosilyticum sp. I15G10I2 TaxID=1892843 RepID=UPI00085CDEA0|nr:hypothetical protein [Cellulosilyticum sp. I15G10I2]